MIWVLILVSSLIFIFHCFNGMYKVTPLQAVRVPLLLGGSIPHQRGRWALSFLLTQGLLTHFTPPCFYLALPTMTQFHKWLHLLWGSLSASINGH